MQFFIIAICCACMTPLQYAFQTPTIQHYIASKFAVSIYNPLLFKSPRFYSSSSWNELETLLDTLPVDEKYSLLLQSYANKLKENRDQHDILLKMELLFLEMLRNKILPNSKSIEMFITSGALTCDTKRISNVLRLLKAGGLIKVFGILNSIITPPPTSSSDRKFYDIVVPNDEREREIFVAFFMMVFTLVFLALQTAGIFITDIHPYATIYTSALLVLGGYDVFIRQGQSIKDGIAGVERLILRDNQRQAHCDAAAFLGGYLLGLPCFCYQPDVIESLKMITDTPLAFNAFQQPKSSNVAAIQPTQSTSDGNFKSILDDFKISFQLPSGGSDSKPKPPSGDMMTVKQMTVASRVPGFDLDRELALSLDRSIGKNEKMDQMLGFGRLMVWMMTPVAAEQLKYGKTVLSDPRRCQQLWKAMDVIRNSNQIKSESKNQSFLQSLMGVIPTDDADRRVWIEWAYYEAQAFVKQYGDLLEEVQTYMNTGVSSVGECVVMIEKELT